MVGALLGQIGSWLGATPHGAHLYVLPLVAAALALREYGWLRFPIPNRRRQTEKVWAHDFGFTVAALMWGLDIGLGFATHISPGFWVLATGAVALADPRFGALLLLAYWIGRALPVWVGPLFEGDGEGVACPPRDLNKTASDRGLEAAILTWTVAVGLVVAMAS